MYQRTLRPQVYELPIVMRGQSFMLANKKIDTGDQSSFHLLHFIQRAIQSTHLSFEALS